MSDQTKPSWFRRTYLKSIGAASFAGLATGSATAQETETTAGGTTTGGTPTTAGTATPGGDWPDLSGTEVQVIIDETSDAVRNYYNGVSQGFSEATGATMNFEFVGRNVSGVQRVTQLLQAGEPPEIFAMNQNNATAFELQGVIEPVTDVMAEIEERLGESNKHVEFEGEQWLVPSFFNINTWFWRGDVAEEIGMERRPSWTWESALQYAEQVSAMDNDLSGIYIPAGSGPHVVSMFRAWLNTIDGSLVEWDGDRIVVNFDSGENRTKMVELLTFLGNAHEYSPVASDSGYSSWARSIPNGVSASVNYIGYRPKMYAIQDEREFAADVHAAQMPENETRTTDGNVDGFGVFSGANVDAAKTFLRYLTQTENIVDLYKINPVHDIPPYPEVRQSEAYTSFLDQLPEAYTPQDTQAYQQEVAQNFETSIEQTDPANPYAGTIAGADAIPNMLQAVLLDDEDPDAVIDQYAQQLQQTLDQAQG